MNISVDGQSYGSWNDLPPQIRAMLASRLPDADGNGVPDFLEGGPLPTQGTTTSTVIQVDGATYQSVDELPPALQAIMRSAFGTRGEPLPQAAPVQAGSVQARPVEADLADASPVQAGEMMLNGERVARGGSPTSAPARTSWFSRLFGRAPTPR